MENVTPLGRQDTSLGLHPPYSGAVGSRLGRAGAAQQAVEQQGSGLVEQGAEPVGAVELLEQLGGELSLQVVERGVAQGAEAIVVVPQLAQDGGPPGPRGIPPGECPPGGGRCR